MNGLHQQAAGGRQQADRIRPARAFSARRPLSAARLGFTLTEILVVIVIIVLILGMAMPVFRFITGSRSEEGATNQISAMLGRARADAVGLQTPVGVLFTQSDDGQTERMAEVELAPCSDWSQTSVYHKPDCVKVTATTPTGATLYFMCTNTTNAGISGVASQPPKTQQDTGNWRWVGGPPLQLRAGTDVETLPLGIGVQTVCNGVINNTGTTRLTDGYFSTGLIVFDGSGRLASQLYAVPDIGPLADALGIILPPSPKHAGYPSVTNVYQPGSSPAALGVESQYGLVVFQREAFVGQGFSVSDVPYTTPNAPVGAAPPTSAAWQAGYTATPAGITISEAQEEAWLDQNATPLLINRYNGTLVRGE
jgi:prepilin-type N-terminal cleavage/methylation domain-containing protein